MSQQTEPREARASVLVICADQSIESLLGELVAFAGHRPVYDATQGAAGESVRRLRPDVALIDTALPCAVVAACLDAGDESGSSIVLVSSTASENELRDDARVRHRFYFPLPGGPRPLARILQRALAERTDAPRIAFELHQRDPSCAVHPSLCAALAGVARARSLARAANTVVDTSRDVRAGTGTRAETRRIHDALRAAVADYAQQLRKAEIPIDAAVVVVRDAIYDCAFTVGVETDIQPLLTDSERWARAAYVA